jgi:hypothetical protein
MAIADRTKALPTLTGGVPLDSEPISRARRYAALGRSCALRSAHRRLRDVVLSIFHGVTRY